MALPEDTDGVKEALGDSKFPAGKVYVLPSSLSERQRSLARELCDERFSWMDLAPYALPKSSHGRRVWLGLVPAGVLEKIRVGKDPLWRALQRCRDVAGIESVLDKLRFEVALAAIAELSKDGSSRYELALLFDIALLLRRGKLRLLRQLRGEGRRWALAFTEQSSAAEHKASGLGAFVLLALVRAKLPIDEVYERFFPVRANFVGEEVWHEVVSALSPGRRDALLAPIIHCIPGEWVARLLDDCPSPALGHAVLQHQTPNSQGWNWWVGKLRRLGKKHPSLLEALSAETATTPPAVALVVTKQVRPRSVNELTQIQQKQLRICGKGYDGKNLPASARLAKGGPNDETNPSFYGARRSPGFC